MGTIIIKTVFTVLQAILIVLLAVYMSTVKKDRDAYLIGGLGIYFTCLTMVLWL